MKQFKLLRVTCDSSAILDFVEKMKKNSPEKFLRASEHTQNIKFELYNYILLNFNKSQNERKKFLL